MHISLPRPTPISPGLELDKAPRWAVGLLSLGLLCFGGTAVLIAQTSIETAAGYEVERRDNTKQTLERDLQKLEADVAGLKSLDRIEWHATNDLKMVKPGSYVYVTVDVVPPGYVDPEAPVTPKAQPAPAPQGSWLSQLLAGLFGKRGAQ